MNSKIAFSLVALASLTAAANADVGVVEATGAFQLAGGIGTTYVSAIGAPSNPRLNQYDFGSVNALAGQSLLLQNWYFENYAYNGGSTPFGAATNNNWLDGSSQATLVVAVMSGGSVLSTQYLSLVQVATSDHNRFWQLSGAAQGTNIAAGLANGNYAVEMFTAYTANQWTGSVSQFNSASATSVASFSVVPAPGALALLGVAGVLGARKRR